MTSIRVVRFHIFIFTILAFTLNGCLLPGTYGSGHKGVKRNKSLSEAVESGNTKSSKSFPTFPTPPLPPIEFVEIGTSIILSPDSADESNRYEKEPHTPPVSRSHSKPYTSGFSASLSTSITGSKQIENLSRHTLQFDTREDQSMLSIKLSFTDFTFDDEGNTLLTWKIHGPLIWAWIINIS